MSSHQSYRRLAKAIARRNIKVALTREAAKAPEPTNRAGRRAAKKSAPLG